MKMFNVQFTIGEVHQGIVEADNEIEAIQKAKENDWLVEPDRIDAWSDWHEVAGEIRDKPDKE